MSEASVPPVNLSRRLEMQQYEQRLERLLEDKFDAIRQVLDDYKLSGQAINPSTEAMISEVVSLFRRQLQASAARGLDDSQMDARGELDFELLKDIIEQKQEESRIILQRDIANLVHHQAPASREHEPELR